MCIQFYVQYVFVSDLCLGKVPPFSSFSSLQQMVHHKHTVVLEPDNISDA